MVGRAGFDLLTEEKGKLFASDAERGEKAMANVFMTTDATLDNCDVTGSRVTFRPDSGQDPIVWKCESEIIWECRSGEDATGIQLALTKGRAVRLPSVPDDPPDTYLQNIPDGDWGEPIEIRDNGSVVVRIDGPFKGGREAWKAEVGNWMKGLENGDSPQDPNVPLTIPENWEAARAVVTHGLEEKCRREKGEPMESHTDSDTDDVAFRRLGIAEKPDSPPVASSSRLAIKPRSHLVALPPPIVARAAASLPVSSGPSGVVVRDASSPPSNTAGPNRLSAHTQRGLDKPGGIDETRSTDDVTGEEEVITEEELDADTSPPTPRNSGSGVRIETPLRLPALSVVNVVVPPDPPPFGGARPSASTPPPPNRPTPPRGVARTVQWNSPAPSADPHEPAEDHPDPEAGLAEQAPNPVAVPQPPPLRVVGGGTQGERDPKIDEEPAPPLAPKQPDESVPKAEAQPQPPAKQRNLVSDAVEIVASAVTISAIVLLAIHLLF
jgi:hypothetical protein